MNSLSVFFGSFAIIVLGYCPVVSFFSSKTCPASWNAPKLCAISWPNVFIELAQPLSTTEKVCCVCFVSMPQANPQASISLCMSNTATSAECKVFSGLPFISLNLTRASFISTKSFSRMVAFSEQCMRALMEILLLLYPRFVSWMYCSNWSSKRSSKGRFSGSFVKSSSFANSGV